MQPTLSGFPRDAGLLSQRFADVQFLEANDDHNRDWSAEDHGNGAEHEAPAPLIACRITSLAPAASADESGAGDEHVGPNTRNEGTCAMTAIAVDAPRPKTRFLLDRPELVGPLFIAPAILYVVVLVALPFFLAIYYSVSAFTDFDPNYQFVGLKNFVDVITAASFNEH
jgi:hypothetical protein